MPKGLLYLSEGLVCIHILVFVCVSLGESVSTHEISFTACRHECFFDYVKRLFGTVQYTLYSVEWGRVCGVCLYVCSEGAWGLMMTALFFYVQSAISAPSFLPLWSDSLQGMSYRSGEILTNFLWQPSTLTCTNLSSLFCKSLLGCKEGILNYTNDLDIISNQGFWLGTAVASLFIVLLFCFVCPLHMKMEKKGLHL